MGRKRDESTSCRQGAGLVVTENTALLAVLRLSSPPIPHPYHRPC